VTQVDRFRTSGVQFLRLPQQAESSR
jgi:hypothetical protein